MTNAAAAQQQAQLFHKTIGATLLAPCIFEDRSELRNEWSCELQDTTLRLRCV
jgi:hypothetical protein